MTTVINRDGGRVGAARQTDTPHRPHIDLHTGYIWRGSQAIRVWLASVPPLFCKDMVV